MTDQTAARACGIDFGTSNSTVGWLRPGHDTLLQLEDGKITLPSVVFFNYEEDHSRFGRAALAEYIDGFEGRLMRSLKSLLGSSLIDSQTEVQGKALPFRHLLKLFIQELKLRAEATAGREFEQVVLGRPVYFVDDNPQADKLAQDTLADIARQVGFKEISFQLEPIAAAFDYESNIEKEELVLIVDIGGGTSDFTLIRLSPERRSHAERRDDILATGGVHIGGTDFDRQLSLHGVMPLFGFKTRLRNNAEMPSSQYFNLATWHTINFAYTRKAWMDLQDVHRDAAEPQKLDRLFKLIQERAGHWLAMEVEAAKIALSDQDSHRLALDTIERGLHCDLSRADFETSIGSLLDRVGGTVSKLLADSGLKAENVDTVFFTGGSSGVPALRDGIRALLPNARHVEGNLFGSIGSGLAIEAKKRYG
ncbi:Hsp70 family protein [Chromobacterium sp. TRC.1.1.SA]|uniref:Hsp70 family protein n=1 Tax=Chromobacterium indicum TaxID=3110228 RepID=A0ABV0CGG2_9NEIS|nr:Hsp70 family protein [Chromobacterium vaccinii]QND85228.1 putative chaperone protein YegD [Chromobacterium vaccinii]QND90459.1 putative chaperone protein YegD [Chromobacterium vaccinii]SUX55194.1 Heat shock protein 70 [Chromobacterium vaccinii]